MGANSDVIYISTDCEEPDATGCGLHRIRLDGTADDILLPFQPGYVGAYKISDRWIGWEINEEAGWALALNNFLGNPTEAREVNVYNLQTGMVSKVEGLTAPGQLALDGNSLVTNTGDPGVMIWWNPATLEKVQINLTRANSGNDLRPVWFRFSPDSKHIVYGSAFGRSMTGYLEGATHRVYVVDLD
jgi:hypothetical protein